MREGLIAMRRGLWMFRGHRRINRGLFLSRLYRARALLYALLALGAMAIVVVLALLLRLAAAALGS